MKLPPVQYTPGTSVDAYFVADNGTIGRSDTFALEAIDTGHWTSYGFPMTEAGGGFFFMPGGGAFPALPDGTYNRYIRERLGVDPDPDDLSAGADGPWLWSGTVLSSAGTSAADVWSAPSRTLTSPATAPAISIVEGVLTIYRGDDWSQAITGLGSITGYTKLYLTAKSNLSAADSRAIFQIEAAGGLLRLNGGLATAGQGAITIDSASLGNITPSLAAEATALLSPVASAHYDVQVIIGGVRRTVAVGKIVVAADVTRAVT